MIKLDEELLMYLAIAKVVMTTVMMLYCLCSRWRSCRKAVKRGSRMDMETGLVSSASATSAATPFVRVAHATTQTYVDAPFIPIAQATPAAPAQHVTQSMARNAAIALAMSSRPRLPLPSEMEQIELVGPSRSYDRAVGITYTTGYV